MRYALLVLALAAPQAAADTVTAHAFEEGTASWYGKEFAGRRTASGEVFDPEGLTAAHRTLPFGTFLLVTNLDNGRHLQVRVNDRGPFVKDRILDCAAGAARALGFLLEGTARVRLEILGQVPPAEDPRLSKKQRRRLDKALERARRTRREVDLPALGEVVQPVDVEKGPFGVQVGAFASRDNATRLASALAAQGYETGVVSRPTDELLRVRVGPVATRAVADDLAARLRAEGHPTFVVRVD